MGLTVIDDPTVDTEPPQDPLYQYHPAPTLSVPPVSVSVVPAPGHIDWGLPVAEVAGVEFVYTITVTEAILLMHNKLLVTYWVAVA